MNPIKTAKDQYDEYSRKMQKIADVRNAAAMMEWDMETYLPEKGNDIRGKQLATLRGIAHEWFAEDTLGELLLSLSESDGLDEIQHKNILRTKEDYDKNKKYTPEFIQELSMTTSGCYHAWIKARKENNYTTFEPLLNKMIALKKKEAGLLGYRDHPYDALVNDFEKGAHVKMLDVIFKDVRKELKTFLEKILTTHTADNKVLYQHFDKNKQWEFGLTVLKNMGFDFSSGRQDISEHPFTTSFNSHDVRITTRIDENDFANMLWSCIHEGGHALYEQGLPATQYGLPCGEAASLAIHESQSRFWENNIGRSLAFWKHFYPELQKQFPEQFRQVALRGFYRAINKVQPSLIRTEADEITYHFHIMIRYELEKRLIGGELHTKDIREAWNEMYLQYLDIKVPDDKSGALQDIHWCHGSFGYFPTYSLGSFYAAQFFHQADQALPGLRNKIESGDLKAILHWLRENIHQYGRMYEANELCEKVTGEKLDFKYFMNYVKEKYKEIYDL
ncbi:MAG: carboxypeptidase M32, partial [Chitinophagaceae bacterium]